MSMLRQLKCPNCGGVVNAPPGAVRATCSFCGSQLAVDVNTNEVRLIVASQQELGKDKDRLEKEHQQVCDWYMDYYNKVQDLDGKLATLRRAQQNRATEDQVRQLLDQRQQYTIQLDAWRQHVAQLDQVISPGISTPLPVPAPLPAPRRRIGRIILLFVLLLLIGVAAIVFSQSNRTSVTTVPGESTRVPATAAQSQPTAQPPSPNGYLYFKETSHAVSLFAAPFARYGGVAALGFPITEAFIEQNPQSGSSRWVQYFEKAVIEYHPEMSGDNIFQLSRLGALRLSLKYPAGLPAAQALPGKNSFKFPETGFTVTDPFLSYWHAGGELRRFGYPITPSLEEKSDADGKTYIVQYFERAVMEYHPEAKPPYDVQLAALGSLRLKQLYPQGAPQHAADPVPEQKTP